MQLISHRWRLVTALLGAYETIWKTIYNLEIYTYAYEQKVWRVYFH